MASSRRKTECTARRVFTFKPKPSQAIEPNSIPNTLFAPTFCLLRSHFPHAAQDALKMGRFNVSLKKRVWPRKVEEPLPQDLRPWRAPGLFSWPLLARMEVLSGGEGWRAQREQPGSLYGFLRAERKHVDCNEYEWCNSSQRGLFAGGVSRWGWLQGVEVERSAFLIGKK